MKRALPSSVSGRIAQAAELRALCRKLPRIYSEREQRLLREFEDFRAGASEPTERALFLGLERMFRRGEYLAMTALAARITISELEIETLLSVAGQAVAQQA